MPYFQSQIIIEGAIQMSKTVKALFDNYPDHIRSKMLVLRELIFEVASKDPKIGPIEETIKWGEPSYIPSKSKSGVAVRIDWKAKSPDKYFLFFNCKTSLVSDFRSMFGIALEFEKNRAISLDIDKPIPEVIIRECVRMAFTYNL